MILKLLHRYIFILVFVFGGSGTLFFQWVLCLFVDAARTLAEEKVVFGEVFAPRMLTPSQHALVEVADCHLRAFLQVRLGHNFQLIGAILEADLTIRLTAVVYQTCNEYQINVSAQASQGMNKEIELS